jgi:hypothetical protein
VVLGLSEVVGGRRRAAPSRRLCLRHRDEEAYLQANDEKQPTPPEPVDPASILCQFCGKSLEQVGMLFQAKRRTMDPNTSAIVAVWIYNECVAQMGQVRAAEPPGTQGLHWWQVWSYRARL